MALVRCLTLQLLWEIGATTANEVALLRSLLLPAAIRPSESKAGQRLPSFAPSLNHLNPTPNRVWRKGKRLHRVLLPLSPPQHLLQCATSRRCCAQVLGSDDPHFEPSVLTFVTEMITSHAVFANIVPTAFRRWIILVKSDKAAFVLALRSSEKLSFKPFKGHYWEAAAFSLRLLALSSLKWRLHVWLCSYLFAGRM